MRYGKLRKVDGVTVFIHRQQANPFPGQNFTDKHIVIFPTELTFVPHSAYQHRHWIFHLGQAPGKSPRRISHTHPPASASVKLHAAAPDCIPGETCPSSAAAPVDWLPDESLLPASACDASARAFRSAPDGPPRSAPPRSPTSSTTPIAATIRLPPATQTALRCRSGSLPACHTRERPLQRSPALVPCPSSPPPGSAADTGCAHPLSSRDRSAPHSRCETSL